MSCHSSPSHRCDEFQAEFSFASCSSAGQICRFRYAAGAYKDIDRQHFPSADRLLDLSSGIGQFEVQCPRFSPCGTACAKTYAYSNTIMPTIAPSASECHTTKRKIWPSFPT